MTSLAPERTDKIPLGSIKKVTSEPIKGHEEYHIMVSGIGRVSRSRAHKNGRLE